jgi:hypothetical protein
MKIINTFTVKQKTIYFILIFGFIVLLLLYLRNKDLFIETNNIKKLDVSRYENMKNNILGKDILSLSQILPIQKGIINKYYFIYLYMSSGCGNCIKKGFDLVNRIDSTFGKAFVKVICAGNGDVSSGKLYYDYNKFIYIDEKELIRKELKYIYTPVFLILDEHFKISFARFFTTYDDGNIINNLIDTVKVKYQKITY